MLQIKLVNSRSSLITSKYTYMYLYIHIIERLYRALLGSIGAKSIHSWNCAEHLEHKLTDAWNCVSIPAPMVQTKQSVLAV
jgi:hypothetical protein